MSCWKANAHSFLCDSFHYKSVEYGRPIIGVDGIGFSCVFHSIPVFLRIYFWRVCCASCQAKVFVIVSQGDPGNSLGRRSAGLWQRAVVFF